jgi:2-polyprenyl-3-methyl-5-hydroxy-6-metoxy-1,4-benzoquinol methylase
VNATELTIVIPTSGRWDVLAMTLDALERQTVSGFQTVVVVNGLHLVVPAELRERPGVRFVTREDEGPGPARNLGASLAEAPLLLFLGDDTIPLEKLVSRHLFHHARDASDEVAVLGHVRWHPSVAGRRVNRWLDWSLTQYDYAQMEASDDIGFGRFYTSNVSLKRSLFERVGGFDPDFRFGYEDIDFGYRASLAGLRLRYEPDAVALHLHPNDLTGLRRRFELVGASERVMASKHEWFEPYFRVRMLGHSAAPPVSRLWPLVVDRVPVSARLIRGPVERRADRWYHQQLAQSFADGWDRELDFEELRAYLGDAFDLNRLQRHTALLDAEAAAAEDEGRFYRTSEMYLYDLTVFAASGTKDPYRRVLRSLLAPGARLLDYGCGIGSDGLRLLEQGYRVELAEFENPSVAYLRWRLKRRGRDAPVHDLDRYVPDGFDAAYAFDVIEHVDDPFALLAELERRARIVVVNLLEPVSGETPLHRVLPIRAILRHAAARGLLRHHIFHGRSHLIAYRGARGDGPRPGRLRSGLERWLGPRIRA